MRAFFAISFTCLCMTQLLSLCRGVDTNSHKTEAELICPGGGGRSDQTLDIQKSVMLELGGSHEESMENCFSACCNQRWKEEEDAPTSGHCNVVTYYEHDDQNRINCFMIQCHTCSFIDAPGFDYSWVHRQSKSSFLVNILSNALSSSISLLSRDNQPSNSLSYNHNPSLREELKNAIVDVEIISTNMRVKRKAHQPAEKELDVATEKPVTPSSQSSILIRTESQPTEKLLTTPKITTPSSAQNDLSEISSMNPIDKPATIANTNETISITTKGSYQNDTSSIISTQHSDVSKTTTVVDIIEQSTHPTSIKSTLIATETTTQKSVTSPKVKTTEEKSTEEKMKSTTLTTRSSTKISDAATISSTSTIVVTTSTSKAATTQTATTTPNVTTQTSVTTQKSTEVTSKGDTSNSATSTTEVMTKSSTIPDINTTPNTKAISKIESTSNVRSTPKYINNSSEEEFVTYESLDTTSAVEDIIKSSFSKPNNGVLILSLGLGIVLVVVVMIVLGKRWYEAYQRRHYNKVDYLINGS